MKELSEITINNNSTIRDAIKVIDKGTLKIAFVINNSQKYLGTISDGDIRRALLKGFDLDSSINLITIRNSIVLKNGKKKKDIIKKASLKKINIIPVTDNNGRLIDLFKIDKSDNLFEKTNRAVIFAGGYGKRLYPLTKKKPKPMLSVGNMPILENIIKNFSRDGYKNIVLCLNYKASVIKKYFGNGKNFGVNIEYVLEKNSLGTAGALSLIKRKIKEPFFVMNSDLLTNLNFRSLHNFHLSHNSLGTMCLKKINFQIPYGVVNLKGNNIEAIKEKPIQKFFINAGIYMLNPECLKKIKKNKFLNMTSLLENLIKEKKKINAFPLREYWLDIGRKEDYLKANDEFNSMIDV